MKLSTPNFHPCVPTSTRTLPEFVRCSWMMLCPFLPKSNGLNATYTHESQSRQLMPILTSRGVNLISEQECIPVGCIPPAH